MVTLLTIPLLNKCLNKRLSTNASATSVTYEKPNNKSQVMASKYNTHDLLLKEIIFLLKNYHKFIKTQ